jgi:hypothetical protein
MANIVVNELIKSAWILSKASPENWTRFLTALDDYTNERMTRAISSPTVELYIAVGMGRQALDFCTVMNSLDELFEKIRSSEGKR